MRNVWGLGSFQVEGGGEAGFDFDTRCRGGVIWIIIRAVNMAIFPSWLEELPLNLRQDRQDLQVFLTPSSTVAGREKAPKYTRLTDFLWTGLIAPSFVTLTSNGSWGGALTFEPIFEQTFKSALKWKKSRKSYTHASAVRKNARVNKQGAWVHARRGWRFNQNQSKWLPTAFTDWEVCCEAKELT